MRPLFYAPFLLLLAACGGGQPASISRLDTVSDPARLKAPLPEERPGERFYVEDKRFDLKNFEVSIQSAYTPGMKNFKGKYYPGDSLKSNVLIVYDRKLHKRDTLDVREINLSPDNAYGIRDLRIREVTRDVRFEKLAFILRWTGDSDHANSAIIGYVGDTLKNIYEDYDDIVDVRRKDQWTLTGHSWGEDEITRHVDSTYLFTISLKTLESEASPPDTLVTKYDTEATDTIHAFRILKTGVHTAYDIMPGTHLRVDTVLPKLQTVIISIKDSIILRAALDQMQLKIKVSTAG